MEQLTVQAFVERLCGNAWKWCLFDFLKHMGLPDNPNSRELFLEFQKAAKALGRFDADNLAKLAS